MPVLCRPRNRSRLLCRTPVLHVPLRQKLSVLLRRQNALVYPLARYHRRSLCHHLRLLRTNLLSRMSQDKTKIRIIEYGLRLDGCITAYSDNGILTLAPCNAKPKRGKYKLFCDKQGRFYSLTSNELRQVRPSSALRTKDYRKSGSAWRYHQMANFVGNPTCHSLVCTAFHGPRPDGYQCDHINGIPTDNRACNLQWVTPAENTRRAKLLRELRKRGLHLEHYNPVQLLHYFQNGVMDYV